MNTDGNMAETKVVCICGGGNGAHVLAGLAAAQAQAEVRVLTLLKNEASKWSASLRDSELVVIRRDDSSEIMAKPAFVTDKASRAVTGADVIIFCVPAFAHRMYLEAIVPHLERHVAIVGLPGRPGFEFQCLEVMRDAPCSVLSYESLPWSCRILEYGRKVEILGTKDTLTGTAVSKKAQLRFDPVAFLQSVLGELPALVTAGKFLDVSLMSKSFIHPALMYAKWKDWDGQPLSEIPLFYQGVSESDVAFLSAVSDEIVTTAREAGKLRPDLGSGDVDHIFPWIVRSYKHSVQDLTSLYTALKTNSAYDGLLHPMTKTVDGKWIPDFTHRYLSEDVPCGLVVVKGLAELAGVASPAIDRLLAWCQVQLGKEFLVGSELKGDDVKATRAPQAFGYKSLDEVSATL